MERMHITTKEDAHQMSTGQADKGENTVAEITIQGDIR
jgi:hypothetical protein